MKTAMTSRAPITSPIDSFGQPVRPAPKDPPERFTPSKQTTEFRNNLLDVLERIHDRLDEIAHRD